MRKFIKFYVLLTVILFQGCSSGGGSNGNMTSNDQTVTSPSGNNIPTCSIYSSIENTQYCTVEVNGLSREFYIYIPSTYSEYISPVQILISLHGGGDYAEYNMQYSGFKEQADQDTFILIYPQGSYYEEKATTGWNTEDVNSDDVVFIKNIIDWTLQNYNTQPSEVYASGFSNGGFMAYHLACNLSADIAAIAPVAGLMGNYTYETCGPIHPTPLIHIHGQLDDSISIYGGDYHRPLEDNGNTTGTISYWKDINQCANFSQENIFVNEINIGTHNIWTKCSNGADINYRIIFNRGHEWDEGDKGESLNFDTSQIIWDFLKKFDINGYKN